MVDVVEVLTRDSEVIVDNAALRLQRSHLPHYDEVGSELARERIDQMLTVVRDCVSARSLVPIIDHVSRIAHERFEAGFDIREVQTAFNVLEESIWDHVVDTVPPRDLAQAIGLVGTVLGTGRDTFARVYVELASQQHVRSLDLSALFHGVE